LVESAAVTAGDQQAEDRSQGPRGAQELLGRLVGGKYRVESILGRGGMGTIYVAEQQPLGRRVALKVLHPTLGDSSSDPEFQKRFLLEAATLSQLAHPNIVVVHDYGSLEEEHAACFMVMELLEGRTINDALKEEGRFDPARALLITREIARALRAAHDLGVIHRDLKPSNVMLCAGAEGELVKVLDFGLVKVLRDDSEELTAEGRFLGSPRYMSPEQIQRLPMDGRTDLYSLGVILYRMLCGAVPFAGDHAVQTLMAHLSKPVPRIEAFTGVEVPHAVEQIVMKLLEKEADARYANATALIHTIDAIWPQLSAEPLARSGEHVVRLSEQRVQIIEATPTPGAMPDASTFSRISLTETVSDPLPPPEPSAEPAPPAPPAPPEERRWVLPLLIALGVSVGVGSAAFVASLLEDVPEESVAQGAGEDRALGSEPGASGGSESGGAESGGAESGSASVGAQSGSASVGAQSGSASVGAQSGSASGEAGADPEPSDALAAPARTFTLTVRSSPSGATLLRGGEELGQTPLTLELDAGELEEEPATFTLRMRGRAPVTFTQGASASDVEIERRLPRLTSRPAAERDPSAGRGGDLSIKTHR
jgi:serine/threonine protein kinase